MTIPDDLKRSKVILLPQRVDIDKRLPPNAIVLLPFFAKKMAIEKERPGTLGDPLDGHAPPEKSGSGRRVRFANGSLYQRPDGVIHAVFGKIGERYESLGGPGGYLGLPLSDEVDFTEGGRANRFDNGSIYWWPDTGAIDLAWVSVRYSGLYAFAETDDDRFLTTSDEPYVLLGVVAPTQNAPAVKVDVAPDVDDGDSRPDDVEVYRGMPDGLALNIVLMEHDTGDTEKYKDAVSKGVEKGGDALKDYARGLEYVGEYLGPIFDAIWEELGPEIVEVVTGFIGAGDDLLGNQVLTLTAKQMVILASQQTERDQWGISYKVESASMTGDGSEYKVYFNVKAVTY